jgi:hypothetical protein
VRRRQPGLRRQLRWGTPAQVVDNVNHSFYTKSWESSRETDLNHWSHFQGFERLKYEVGRRGLLRLGPCRAAAAGAAAWMPAGARTLQCQRRPGALRPRRQC